MLIELNSITKILNQDPLFENLSLILEQSDRIGLVGENGSGKSTLFKLITGEENPSKGVINRKKNLTIGYLQQTFTPSDKIVKTYLLESDQFLNDLYQQLTLYEEKLATVSDDHQQLAKVMTHYGKLQHDFEENGGYDIEDRIASTLKALNSSGLENKRLNQLSGGQRLRVELVRVILSNNDYLLLDEPTNYLDIAGIEWLENYLSHLQIPYMVISHDRQFLDRVTTKTLEIEDGQIVPYNGNYTRYTALKKERVEALQKNFLLKQQEKQKLKGQIKQYRQWGNESGNEKFYRKAKSLEKRLAKISLPFVPQESGNRLESVKVADRSANNVVKVNNLWSLIEDQILLEDVTFTIKRNDRIALIGRNGSGKSTLMKLIVGELTADEGTIELGNHVKMGYLPQQIEFPLYDVSILDYAKTIMPNEEAARRALAHFGFYAQDVSKRLKSLSGGERVRLALLPLLQQKINFLLLDEPTNHLDIYAKEEIEHLLEDYSGTLVFISHDRYMIQKLSNRQLIIQDRHVVQVED